MTLGARGIASPPAQRSMTKLLEFRFDDGRPRLSLAQEGTIRLRVAFQSLAEPVRDPAMTLVVIGYIDDSTAHPEDSQIAFRRAQMFTDFLREKCGAMATVQVTTMEVSKLPSHERRDKQRMVEVWAVNP